ncbi:MAG: carbohydrate ABC transporter permease [Clostridia bacterium]
MIKRILAFSLLFFLALFIWYPLCMLFSGALTPTSEMNERLCGVLGTADTLASWPIIPSRLTFKHVVELLLDTPEFFVVFWNSCIQVFPAVIGQVLVGAPAAWALARFHFRGRNALNWLYIVLMILPFQVTMASSYIVLSKLSLVDTHLAVILPALFSAFPVFIMSKFFGKIPQEMLEAARIDGASELQLFMRIGVPMGAPGILSAALLGFMECWNAVEQPITFLKTPSLFPLSIFLPNTTLEQAGVSFVVAIITLLPALLLFLYGQQNLEQGILASGIKE